MTFHGTNLVRVLEEILPAKAGGRPGDYQLVECEGPRHATMLRLHISPRANVTDVDRVRELFLSHIRSEWGGALATRVWAHSGAVEAVVAEPYVTRTGKVHPIRLLGAFSTDALDARFAAQHAGVGFDSGKLIVLLPFPAIIPGRSQCNTRSGSKSFFPHEIAPAKHSRRWRLRRQGNSRWRGAEAGVG